MPEHQRPLESTALPGFTKARTMVRPGGAPFLLIILHIISIHSVLRSGPSRIQGRFTPRGRILIPIARILIATDGLVLAVITAGRQLGRRKSRTECFGITLLLGETCGWGPALPACSLRLANLRSRSIWAVQSRRGVPIRDGGIPGHRPRLCVLLQSNSIVRSRIYPRLRQPLWLAYCRG